MAAVLDRVVAGFQEQAFLRVDLLRFTRRNAEEQRIELVDVGDESAPAAVAGAGLALLRIIMVLPAPTVGGYFADATAAGRQVFPETIEIGRLRIASAHADDGDIERNGALLGRRIRRGHLCADRQRCRYRGRFLPGWREATPTRPSFAQRRRWSDGRRGARRHVRRCARTHRDVRRHSALPCKRRHHRGPIPVEEMAYQAVDALYFEKQGAAHIREQRAEACGQLDHENAVQPILLERSMRLDIAVIHAQCGRDDAAEQRRAGLAQGIIIMGMDRRRRRPLCHRRSGRRRSLRQHSLRRARAGRNPALGQYRCHRRRIAVQEVAHQAIDAAHFEKQGAAHIGKQLAEPGGQLDHQDAVQTVLFERSMGLDRIRLHAQHSRDHLAEQRTAGFVQCAIFDRGRDGDRGRGRNGLGMRLEWRRHARAGAGTLWSQALADHAVAASDDDLLAEAVVFLGRETDLAEALELEKPFPLRRRQAGTVRQAQALILVQPPPFEQAKGEVRVPAPFADLVDEHDATTLEQGLRVAHGLAHVGGGMQHVGGDHHVVAIALDRLQRERLAYIEDRSAQRRERRLVGLLRMQQESPGQVGIAILFDQFAETAENGQQHGRCTAGAGTDLEESQATFTACRPGRDFLAQMLAEDAIEMVGDGMMLVDTLDHVHRRVGKHHVGRRHGAREDSGQIAQAGIDQGQIGAMAAVLAPSLQRRPPCPPQCIEVIDFGKSTAVGIESNQLVPCQVAQGRLQPAPAGWAQTCDDFGRCAIAMGIREQGTQLRCHDAAGETLGIGRQPGGLEIGGGDVQRDLGVRWRLVRCVHARCHIPVEFMDLLDPVSAEPVPMASGHWVQHPSARSSARAGRPPVSPMRCGKSCVPCMTAS